MINFELLNQYMDNDVDIIIAVFSTYLEDYSDATEQLNEMFVQQNWPELYLMAHSLKGILEGFGEDRNKYKKQYCTRMRRYNYS